MSVVNTAEAAGPIISGFHSWVALIAWVAVVLAYGLYRSMGSADADPIRSSGPLPD